MEFSEPDAIGFRSLYLFSSDLEYCT